jgi:diacylglycerol kinase family enzyme
VRRNRSKGVTLLVANPTARTGKAEHAIADAIEGLESHGMRPEFFATLPEGETVGALATRLEREDTERVVYLGGDGTFAETAKGLILARERCGVDIPMGMLPMGTANDQGRSFGLHAGASALSRNLEVIAEGCEQWLDVGRIEAIDEHGAVIHEDLWFDNAGFGLSARILAQRNRDRDAVSRVPLLKRVYRDKLVYAGASFASLFKSMVSRSRFSCSVTVDDETHEYTGLTDIVINGTYLYGGEWIFAAQSKPDDGKFELITFQSHADWVSATVRSHKRNPVTEDDRDVLGVTTRPYVQGRQFEVRLFSPSEQGAVPAQIDGEEFSATNHYRVENLFHHMRIIVPEDSHWV